MKWSAAEAARHHDGSKYFNPHDDSDHGVAGVLKWVMNRKASPWRNVPVIPAPQPPQRVLDREMHIIWVGHSTLLVQWAGVNILTDPVWSKRISPISGVGPRRFAEPGLAFEDLPPIDLVLISHNHYDHLDAPTVKALIRNHDPQFVVPLGLKEWLSRQGTERAIELDWWEGTALPGLGELTVTATPVQHFSGRGPFDRNQSLWAGFVVQALGERFFFAGDTGYSPDFKEIGRIFAPIRLAAIPIGAYDPQWFMAPVHVTPEHAVAIHQDIGAQRSVGIHHGTFKLTDEPQDEPPERLRAALFEAGIPLEHFAVLAHGGDMSIPSFAAQEGEATG